MDYLNFNGSIPDLIKIVFEEKKIRNPKYSLRALARDIGIPPGRLSEVMAGKRNMTLLMAQKLVRLNKLQNDEKNKIFELIKSQNKLRSKKITDRNLLSAEEFSKVCHWHYYALMCLIDSKTAENNIGYFAEKLNLNPAKIKEMLQTMESAKLIKFDGQKYQTLKSSTTTSQDSLNRAIQNFHREMVYFHLSQVENVSTEFRDLQSLIIPFAVKNVPKAKKMLRNFIDEFEKKFGTSTGSDVFGLSFQLTPLTVMKEEKNG
jgi:uncharacterized protein (TIGR02147 family)